MGWSRVGMCAAIVGLGASTAVPGLAGAAEVVLRRPDPGQVEASAAGAGALKLRQVGRFNSPVYATGPNGDDARLFVVEQGGRIKVVVDGRVRNRPFLDIGSRVSQGSEQGLLSMAFPPDYRKSRRFYVDFTDRAGDTRVVEYRVSRNHPNRAKPASARLVLKVDQPASNHNGGQVQFGPDGLLYVGLGDGGGAGDPDDNGQDLGTLLGKVLRIDPRASRSRAYAVPASNPFVGGSGARPEIYAYGLRNPWRFSFDRGTGALAIADVGQDAREEVNFAAKDAARGANYGWRVFEGDRRFSEGSAPNAVAPVLAKSHDDGWCAIVGGYVVRDTSLPALAGRYLYGDFCNRELRSVALSAGAARDDRATGVSVGQLSSFGQDGIGRIYAVSLGGPVYRLTG